MSLNANTLLKAVKQAAVDAVRAEKPMALAMGIVVSADPLAVCVDQRMTLKTQQLMLTNAVRDYTVTTTDANGTEGALTLHLGLATGDKVLLLRCDGGQKYMILDRLEALHG